MSDIKKHLYASVVAPCHNEEGNLKEFIEAITHFMTAGKAELKEIILVDDGSHDSTWDEIVSLKSLFPKVTGIKFSRNFGKESALYAGLIKSTGDFTITIDADLQHPPEKIPEMIQLWEEGYRIINARKTSYKNKSINNLNRSVFFFLSQRLTKLNLKESCDFKLLDKKVVASFREFNEFHLFYRGLADWIGFKKTDVEIEIKERSSGSSSFTFLKLMSLAKTGIISFTAAPLYLVTIMAIIFFLVAVILASITLFRKFTGEAIDGFTTVILLQLFIGGVVMFSLGLIGEYLARVYDEAKHRPRFVIDEEI
jgi:polyisoprenyl-phosphate glycosyltransferase